MSGSPRAGCLPRIGGALALDFCNTTTGRGTEHFVEHLFDHEDLLRWAVFNELMRADEAAALAARLSEAERQAAFAHAMAVRALLNRIFDALARGAPVEPKPVAELGTLAAGTWRSATLVPAPPAYAWRFPPADATADAFLDPILRSAAELLTHLDPARLKACAGPDCGWVFLDATKNAGRIWCEMEVCGTRAKLRARAARRAAGRARSD